MALAFKLEDGAYGQLTYIRALPGHAGRRATTIVNTRTGKKVKVGRLVRMHAAQMEDIDKACAGRHRRPVRRRLRVSGDTFTGGESRSR